MANLPLGYDRHMAEWTAPTEVKLLTGGNPQIPKGDGDAPVQAYIEAMPEWKREVGRQLDALIVDTVPGVQKAVRWNSPFYGLEGRGWFVSFYCFTKYVKITWHKGAEFDPVPAGDSKHPEVRYTSIFEDDDLEDMPLVSWLEQAAALDGEMLF